MVGARLTQDCQGFRNLSKIFLSTLNLYIFRLFQVNLIEVCNGIGKDQWHHCGNFEKVREEPCQPRFEQAAAAAAESAQPADTPYCATVLQCYGNFSA